jgi:hypothetical protein
LARLAGDRQQQNGTNWVTHSYARHRGAEDPPEAPALRELLNIIAERAEAEEVHPFRLPDRPTLD